MFWKDFLLAAHSNKQLQMASDEALQHIWFNNAFAHCKNQNSDIHKRQETFNMLRPRASRRRQEIVANNW